MCPVDIADSHLSRLPKTVTVPHLLSDNSAMDPSTNSSKSPAVTSIVHGGKPGEPFPLRSRSAEFGRVSKVLEN